MYIEAFFYYYLEKKNMKDKQYDPEAKNKKEI